MKHLLQSFGTTLAIQLLNVVSGIATARLLLPEGRGQLAAIMLWPAIICSFGSLSIDQGVAYHAASQRQRASVIIMSGLLLAAMLALVGILIGWFILPVVLEPAQAALLSAARLYLLFIPLYGFGLLLNAAQQGALRFGSWNLLRLIVPFVLLLAIGAFYAAGWIGVASFAVANLLGNATSVGAGFWLVCREHGRSARIELGALSEILRYSLGIHVAMVVSYLVQRLDQAVIALYLPSEALGDYVIATSVALTATIAAGPLGVLAFAKMAGQETAGGRSMLFGRYFRLTLIVCAGSAVALFVLARLLVPLFYGRAFLPAVPLVHIMLLGTVPASLTTLLTGAYKAYNRTLPITYAYVAGVIVAVPMLALLVPRLGVAGAAWALVAAQWAPCLFFLLCSEKFTGVSARTLTVMTRADIDLLRGHLARVMPKSWLKRESVHE